jgi:cysteine desulfuration protein SufE
MQTPAFQDILDTFEFLDGWEDRYRHIIEMGRAFPAMEAALKTPATKVEGCASQVWIYPEWQDGRLAFAGDSDAMIVKGLIAVLHAIYAGLTPAEAARVDAQAELARLGLDAHLSAQRSNGVRAMVARLRAFAEAAA